ncbi:Unannotated [Lentimonas sp. CC4]|nr:Unannotated [Lentimonas sp. CC4]CAA6684983.1 Unannotated [Lentimonas sp. CC6]CAA7077901.1 Unannotated [Lentimonas sp. CC4]CAA7169826.1 Unannotated [Lentimonas sp. CC21]CAA7179945.1 Unannotated [Lentimonas sp. CC8]
MRGKLGGHLGRKHDGLPRELPIGRGLSKLYQFIDNSELMRSLQSYWRIGVYYLNKQE